MLVSYEVIDENLIRWNWDDDISLVYTNRKNDYLFRYQACYEEETNDEYTIPNEWIGTYHFESVEKDTSFTIYLTDMENSTIDANDGHTYKIRTSEINETRIKLMYNTDQIIYTEKTGIGYTVNY